MNTHPRPKLGVTAYSFSPDFHALKFTFEQLVHRIATAGLGPGLEVVGFQSLRGFPQINDATVAAFQELIDQTGLEPSCLALNGDAGIHAGRLLDDTEMADYMAPQLHAAARMGFRVARFQKTVSAGTAERLVPLAEALDVKMGYEIHSPDAVDTDWVLALRDVQARLQTPYLGFVPDWGSSTVGPSPSMWAALQARGLPQHVVDGVTEAWHSQGRTATSGRHEGQMVGEFAQLAASLGAGELAMQVAVNAVGIFGHQKPEQWKEIAAQIVHVHGKFFSFTEDGTEPSIPNRELLTMLVAAGYDGYISSEWEAWHWDSTPDAFEMVRKHHELEARILDDLVPA